MSKEMDKTLDIAGIGKAMQSIPASSWNKLISTACDTFRELVSPLTKSSIGLANLIEAKFDRLLDTEKLYATKTLQDAQRKVKESGKEPQAPKPRILIEMFENLDSQTDEVISELWANLLAQEMTDSKVHPEVARILSRLSGQDAHNLAQIAKEDTSSSVWPNLKNKAIKSARVNFWVLSVELSDTVPTSFSHEHLKMLGLISSEAGIWSLTSLGEGFLEAVTDPTITTQNQTEDTTQ